MAGSWQNFPQSFGMYSGYYTTPQSAPQYAQTAGFYGAGSPFQPPYIDRLHTGIPEYDDLSRSVLPAQGANRIRRRINAGGEHVKFRRTRSGCYTCRNRRVKCDENRPVCERCRKGNRECIYPDPPSATKARRDSTKSRSAHDGDSASPDGTDLEDLLLEDDDVPDSAIEEPESATSTEPNDGLPRASSDPPSLANGSSPSPSTEASATLPRAQTSTLTPFASRTRSRTRTLTERKIHELPDDIRFYLQYASTQMSPHHWGVRIDHQHFFRKTIIEVALRYDPLLYALVGFAAYHCTLSKPDGQLEDFLGYYQKSVTLLRQGFRQKPTIATILTILQLATIEEYLGDWVNLMAHQKAALTLITQLYTPERIVAHESLRKVLHWYIRFDVFVGILSGSATQLGVEWFTVQHEFYKQQIIDHPESLAWKYEERYAWIRGRGFEVRNLVEEKAKGLISEEVFDERLAVFEQEIRTAYDNLDSALTDPSKRVQDLAQGRVPDPEDIVDPFEPNLLWSGDNFDTNMVRYDILGFETLFLNQVGSLRGKLDIAEIRNCCLKLCQLYRAAMMYSESPAGLRFAMQAGLALSVLFLRADDKEVWWGRRMIAEIETKGYTYPVGLRNRLENLWGLGFTDWWLPEEQPRLVKQIRDFVQSKPQGEKEQSLYELKGIFTSLQLGDVSSPESLTNSPVDRNRPGLARTISTKSIASVAASEDGQFDIDMIATHDRVLALGESPDFGKCT